MSDDSPESLGDEPTYVGRRKEREDQSLGDQSTYAGSNESSLSDLGGIGDDLGDSLAGLEIVDLESRYTIIRSIGKGGMGEVFLATDTRLNRKVAIKRIKDELTTPAAAARFLTEAKSIAALSHPYIVQVYDYGRAKDGPFLIMEYVAGENLQQVCNKGVMALEEAVDLSCKLCDALSKAHGVGIIHRDIKPANILMTEEGWPKISDFGLAKSTSDHGHTITGTALGTLDFMPPEQRRDASAVDHRSDLWSLAATIYQMVTGEPPKVIDLEEVPPVLRTVLGKALKTQPDKRYQNVKSLKDDIEQCNSSDALPIGQLNIGECPSCNTRNESNRKYCRECAASLLVDCLECGESIAVWDKICGECGNNQEEALKAKRSEYTGLQEDAEGLRLSYRYDEAIESSKQIGEDYASIFPDAAAWAEKFTADTKRDQAEQLEKTEKIYDAAKKARLNYDYNSACQMIEEIPGPLRLDEVKDFLETTGREYNKVQLLQWEINDRLNSKNLDGLLQFVEQLLELQPERSSVKRLHKKAVKWDEEIKLRKIEGNIEALSGKGMFFEALLLVEDYLKANPNSNGMLEVRGNLKKKLKKESEKTELIELRSIIKKRVRDCDFDGLIELVRRALELSEGTVDLLNLEQQLVFRDPDYRSQREKWARLQCRVITGHTDSVLSVSCSPIGERIVSGSKDSTVKIFDLETGKETVEFKLHQGAVNCVSYSPDGKSVVSEGADRKIKIWDAQTGEEKLSLFVRAKAEPVGCQSIAFTGEASRVVCIGDDFSLKVLSLTNGRYKTREASISCVACSSDGNIIVTGGRYSKVRIWGIEEGYLVPSARFTLSGHRDRVNCVAVSPDGKSVASGSNDTTIKIWDANTGKQRRNLTGHLGKVISAAFSPDGKYIVSGSSDKTIKVWSSKSGMECLTLSGHSRPVNGVAFTPDGKKIVSCSHDKTIRIWTLSPYSSL